MSEESWLPAPPFGFDDGDRDRDRPYDEHHDREHHDREHHGYEHHQGYDRSSHRADRGMALHDRVRSQYGHGVSVGDVLSFLDYRVNELHAAFLETDRHASRVPGSPVRMSGLDAALNADANAWRALTELGDRLDRVEHKLDALLARLPEGP